MLDYPSWTMLRTRVVVLVNDGLVPDREVNCLLIDELACGRSMRMAAHKNPNVGVVLRRSVRGV